MANDKKFVVKNGLQANNVAFVNESNASNIIEASMLSTDTLSFSGNAGQLFSISDTMSGVIFGVNDVSGVPSIEVDDTGDIRLAELGGNVSIGTTLDTHKLYVQGNSFVNGAFTVNGNFTVTDVTVSGNLTVSGTTTYINTTSLNVGDNIITLNADVTGATAPSENAGIEINRGSSANVQFIWDETNDRWSTNGQPLALSSLLATSSINAASFTVGSNFIANTTGTYHTGVINSASFTVGSNFIANTAGAYHTGVVNAATLSVGSNFIANTTGAYHSTLVNSASFTIGSNFIANTTGAYHTGVVNAATISVATNFVANTTGAYHTALMNSASFTVGSNFIANTTGAYHTGTMNAAILSVGSSFIANTTGAYHTGVVNAATLSVGTNITANSTRLTLAVPTLLNNQQPLRFQTVNTSAFAYMVQQNDDNFVFYTSNTTYGQRAVWSIFANSITSSLNIDVPLKPSAGLIANNTIGSSGQVLKTNGSTIYWDTAGGTGTVTQIVAANGLSGGTITAVGQIDVVGGSGLVSNSSGVHIGQGNGISVSADAIAVTGGSTLTVNATGVHVNSALSLTDLTLTGNLTVSGTTTYINTTNLNVGDNVITLNADLPGATAPTENAGIEVNRGSSANVQFIWDETNDRWSTNGQPLALSSLVATGAASGITTLAAGNTTITGFANVSVSVNSAAFTVGSSYTANATTLRISSNSFFTQDYAAGTGSIGGFLSYNPESQMAIHPFLANDLANLRLRGGTVGANTNVPVSNAIFDSLFDSTPTYTRGFANTTANTILEFTNLPSELQYGSAIGISFGATSWAPSSLSIDALTNGVWVSCYSNTAFNATQVVVPIPGNAAPGTTAIRFTMGANTSTRIAHIWGYDYNSDGWSTAAMPRSGGAFYGSISVSGTFAAGNTTITGFANVSTVVNSAAFTIGTVTVANTTGITTTVGANAINLTNATSNWIYWNTAGVGAPTAVTRSAGTKLVVYPAIAAGSVDYGLGIEGSHLWFSAASTAAGFKWYSNTTNILTANTTGLLLAGTLSGVTTAAMGNTTITGFANIVSGNVQLSSGFDIVSPDNFAIYDSSGARDRFGFSTSNIYDTRSGGRHIFNVAGTGVANLTANGILLSPNVGSLASTDDAFEIFPTSLASSHETRNYVRLNDIYNAGVNGQAFYIKSITNGVHYGGWMLNSTWGAPIRLGSASGDTSEANNAPTTFVQINQSSLSTTGLTFSTGNTTITGFANVSVSVNSAAYTVGSTVIANTSGIYATQLNGQLASFYTNATNITTGTLPYAQIPANIVNTTAAFTYAGIQTYNANVVIGATGEIVINSAAGISANGTFGTAGQMLTTNGSAAYWSTPITGVTAGAGLTGGGTSGALTVNVGAGTGIVVNTDDIAVNASYIATISANNASFLQTRTWEAPGTIGSTTANTGAFTSMTVNSGAVYRSDWIAGFQSTSDFTLGTLVTTDIPANVTNGDSFLIEITGKSYSASNPPFKVIAQGYLYTDTIIAFSGISYGGVFASYIKIFEEGGVLKFWWPTISYWNSFNVMVTDADAATNGTITRNRVTSITNIAEPTGTKKVQVNLATYMRADITATNAAEVRATLFRDSVDTAYYLDPGNTSVSMVVAGNISVGTTSSSARLHVNGAVRIEHTGDRVIDFIRSSANTYSIEHDTARMYFYNVSTANVILSFTNGSNVGVGIGDATSKLQVNYGNPASVPSAGASGHGAAFGAVGYGLATGALTNGNAYLQATRWDGTATNYNLLLQPNGGNVGIGTASPGRKLAISGDGIIIDNGSSAAVLEMYSTTDYRIQATADWQVYDVTNSAARLYITSTGNVGIGTTSITGKLDIVGGATQRKIQLSGSAFTDVVADLFISRTGTSNTSVAQAPSIQFGNATDASGIMLQGSSDFQIFTNNAGAGWNERFRLTNGGNVGIGTTTPRGTLSLGTSLGTVTTQTLHFGYTPADFYGFRLNATNTPSSTYAGTFSIQRGNGTAWTDDFNINNSGNVGVGTTSPQQKFVVSDAGAGGIEIIPTGVIQSYNRSTSAYQILYHDASQHLFRIGTSNAAIIDTSSNFGIGTTSPAQRLDVSVASGAEGNGLAVTNLQAGGYGSGINFYSLRGDGTTKIVAGAIRMIGQAAWDNDTNTSSNMRFYTVGNNTLGERMMIDATGNIGIGTSTTNTGRLSVQVAASNYLLNLINGGEAGFALRTYNHGSSSAPGLVFTQGIYYNTTENAAVKFYRGGGGTGGYLAFTVNDGTVGMTLDASRNLGFGSSTRQMINLWSNNYGIGVQNSTTYFRTDARFSWFRGGVHTDTENDAGTLGTTAMTLDSSSNLIVTGEVRGTLFRDTANSSFYVDPVSTSVVNNFRANTIQFSDGTTALTLSNGTYNLINDRSGRVAIYLGGGGDQSSYYDNTNHFFRNTGGALYATINVTGSFANAFYDTANNTYVAKPSGTSRLNALSLDTMVVTSGVTGLTTAPIVTQENNIGTTASWMPLTHQKALYTSGYRTHLSTGLYKTADAWGSGATGWYAAIGGNDNYPTQAWYLTYDASILNSLGYVTTNGSFRAPLFYDSANTSFYVDLNSSSNVSGEFNIQHSGANGFKITSTSGAQAFWARTGYDTNGTATPAVSATNVMLQSSGSSAGTFTFVCGNTLALTVLGDYAQGAGSLRAPIFYDSANTSFYADYGASTIAASLNGRILGGFGADSTGGTLDWNHVTNSRSGSGASLLLGTDTNGPGGSIYFHPFNFEYSTKDGSGNMTQLAIAYGTPGDRMAMRGRYSGSWSGWCEFITNNGTTQTKTGSFISSTDLRAPIFYDSANTSFYLDAASTGTSLNVAGAIVAAGNITAYSDIRVKNNIAVISYAINKLDKISGITYTRNDLKDKERRYAGVIAQEIEEVLPEAVFGDENTKTVDYNATIALLIQAVKEQQVLINNLEQRISLLENK